MSFFSTLLLPLVLVAAVLHRLLPARLRWIFLLAISLAFYATQGIVPLAVLVGMLVVNVASVALGLARRRIGVGALVALDLAALFLFKYVPWLARDVFGAAVASTLAQIALPLGMSFYTFQLIAYVIDSHRAGRALLQPWNAASFVVFFPQLAAGPILRASRDGLQFRAPTVALATWPAGLTRVLWGLFKKRVVADALSPLIQTGFNSPPILSQARARSRSSSPTLSSSTSTSPPTPTWPSALPSCSGSRCLRTSIGRILLVRCGSSGSDGT
jgi:D-alanyl-lipoteichoic acid acyltransferase DltB (MBOAT superfamily)